MTALSAVGVGQAELDAAMLLLSRMGITPADLLASATPRPPVPTFAEYIPKVSAAVSDASRRAYDPYWKKVNEKWATRRLDEPTPSEIEQLCEHVRATAVVRRNGRGGTSAVENLITALRCLYRHAVADNLIDERHNPAAKVEIHWRQFERLTAEYFGGSPSHPRSWRCCSGTPRNAAPPTPRTPCCATATANPSPTAATTIYGNASGGTCPGSPGSRSAPSGYATRHSPG